MKVVEKFSFHPRSKYKFHQFTDGQIRELNTMEEYGVQQHSFRTALYNWAHRNGHIADTITVKGNLIQFRLIKE